MKHYAPLAAVVVALIWDITRAHACAGCSNPNLPTARGGAAIGAGELSVSANMTGTFMNVVHSEYCPEIGPICSMRNEPPQLHDLDFYVGELRPIAELGITDVFGAELQLPVRFTRTSVVFRRLDGTAFSPDYANIHHRNETLVGIADPWLSGRAAWKVGAWRVAVRLGLTVPLGRTEADPFAAGEAGEEHQHIQFGTGTFNPLVGAEVSVPFATFQFRAYSQSVLALYENGHGYQAGSRYAVGLALDALLGSRVTVGMGVDVLNEQPERWDGQIQQDGNIGRTDLLVGTTMSVSFGSVNAVLNAKFPVWQHFSEAGHSHDDEKSQLTYPAIINLGLEARFRSLW